MAIACFPHDKFAVQHGIRVSLLPNMEPLLPLHPDTHAIYIAPHGETSNPTAEWIFRVVRAWGSIRSVNLNKTLSEWDCRVEFWHESEAKRFKDGFKPGGWQIVPGQKL
jgi:hypothetical protein